MNWLPSSVSIYLCEAPVDMRKGFDGLSAIVRNTLGMDPLAGGLFLFLSKRKNRVKILFWDRDGYALFYKRLEKGCFVRPRPLSGAQGAPHLTLAPHEMTLLLSGIDLSLASQRKRFSLPRPASPPP
jgi:transposase